MKSHAICRHRLTKVPWRKRPFSLAPLIHHEVSDYGFVCTRVAHWCKAREKEELGLEVQGGGQSTWLGRGTS